MNAPASAPRLGLLLLAFAVLSEANASPPGLVEATPDTATTVTGQSVLVDVIANDADVGAGRRLVNALPAGNGRTKAENGLVRYTPDPGFVGSDQFQYLVQAPKSPPRLGTVTVEVGGGGVLLTLSGQVVDDPIPGATVTVSVGGIDFTAVADENGYYVIDIAALSGDDFVTITAVGTSPTGAPVNFVSLVGAIARLNAEAGDDGVLTMDENNQVNATHLSTAQYVLLAEANGGTPPGDDDALLQLTQNIDIDELIELAAVIKLVVDGGEPLPEGVDSVLDLISDDAALDAFVEALDPGQLDDAIADVTEDTADLAGFSPTRMPSGYAAIYPGDTGTIRVGVGGQFLVSFDGLGGTSGTGEIVDAQFRDDPGITWEIVDGVLQIRYDVPDVFTTTSGGTECPYTQVYTNVGLNLRRLQDGANVDYLSAAYAGSSVYTDLDPGDGCPAPDDYVFGDVGRTMLGFEDGAGEIPFGASESFGTMMLPYYRDGLYPGSPGTRPWGAGLFDFATSVSQVPGFDPGFDWSVAGGRLHVTLTDPVAGARPHEYRRYQTDGRKGEGVMAIITDGAGRRATAYSLAVRVDGSLPAFTLPMLPGRWRSGFDISQFPGDSLILGGFFLRMYDDAARSGVFESVTLNPDGTSSTSLFPPMTWGVADSVDAGPGAMEALTFRRTGFGTIAWCEVGVDAGCVLFRRRTWTPLAMDGNRVYVLERLNYTVTVGVELVSERANFYELGPLP